MIKNYFKVAFRNFIKHPLSSFINVLGLSAGVACCVIAYAYLSVEFGMERQHTNADRIFMVTNLVDRDGNPEWYGITPNPIGLKLKEDFPQITHLSRVEDRGVIVQRENSTFKEWVRMVDPDYLDMFDFELEKGNKTAIDDLSGVIIHKEMAKKYFGNDDPMGQTINFRFSGSEKMPLTVTGVADVDEMKTSFEFDFLVNFNLLNRVDAEFGANDWSKNISSNLIMLNNPAEIKTIQTNIKEYVSIAANAQEDWEIIDYQFEPINTIYDRSADIRWDISREADVEGQYVISIIAFLMLLLACLNYLNIAITSAVKRLKEIGVRKVIGANRVRLVIQFMVENVLLSAIALVIGLLIGIFFFLPGLNNVFGITMGVEVLTPAFYMFIVGLLLLTAILSGAYPALYISKFQVISIFKGKTSFGKKNVLSKVFLTLEFVIACISVTCGVLFTLNSSYQQSRPWGYDKESLLVLEFENETDLRRMENEVSDILKIEAIATGRNHLGSSLNSAVIELPDQKIEARKLDVDERYIEATGLQLVSGSALDKRTSNQVLVNETYAKTLNLADPIGSTFRYDSTQYTVKGVLKDFHYYSFWNEIQPAFVRIADEADEKFLILRTSEENLIPLYEEAEVRWKKLFPNDPFAGQYQTDLFGDYFRNVNGHRVLMTSVSIMAILMTTLGLYGLIGLNVSGRKKEFSIRKVLGAGKFSLSRAISSHFIIFLAISLLIGLPLSYLTVHALFEMIYTYHMEIKPLPIIGSSLLIVLTIVGTIFSHLTQVLKDNPTDGLRAE